MIRYAVFFLPGLIAGISMFKGKFDRNWRFFWSAVIGIYFALWSMPAILPSILKLGEMEKHFGPPVVLLLLSLVFSCILFFGFAKLYAEDVQQEYNETISHIFGFFSAFIVTTVIVAFALYLLMISPVVKFVPSAYVDLVENFSCRTLLISSRGVDGVSLQRNGKASSPNKGIVFLRQAWLKELIAFLKPAKNGNTFGALQNAEAVRPKVAAPEAGPAPAQQQVHSSGSVPGPAIRRMVAPATRRNRQVNQAQMNEL